MESEKSEENAFLVSGAFSGGKRALISPGLARVLNRLDVAKVSTKNLEIFGVAMFSQAWFDESVVRSTGSG